MPVPRLVMQRLRDFQQFHMPSSFEVTCSMAMIYAVWLRRLLDKTLGLSSAARKTSLGLILYLLGRL